MDMVYFFKPCGSAPCIGTARSTLCTKERVSVNATTAMSLSDSDILGGSLGSAGAGSSSTIWSLRSHFRGRKGLLSSDSWSAVGLGARPSAGRGSRTRGRGRFADFPTALFTRPMAEGPASGSARGTRVRMVTASASLLFGRLPPFSALGGGGYMTASQYRRSAGNFFRVTDTSRIKASKTKIAQSIR
jgi:hypothetical protein